MAMIVSFQTVNGLKFVQSRGMNSRIYMEKEYTKT